MAFGFNGGGGVFSFWSRFFWRGYYLWKNEIVKNEKVEHFLPIWKRRVLSTSELPLDMSW